MKFSIIAIILAFTTINAEARDSTWLLCDNGKLALNVLEHRGAESKGALELTLMWGGRVMQGSLTGQERDVVQAGEISLAGKDASFVGKVSVNLAKKTAVLAGTLSLDGFAEAKSAFMKCKEMDNHN